MIIAHMPILPLQLIPPNSSGVSNPHTLATMAIHPPHHRPEPPNAQLPLIALTLLLRTLVKQNMHLLIRAGNHDVVFLADSVLLIRAKSPLVRGSSLRRDLVSNPLDPVDGWRCCTGARWRGWKTDRNSGRKNGFSALHKRSEMS